MLNVGPHRRPEIGAPGGARSDADVTIDLHGIFRFLRRRAVVIGAVAACVALAALIYCLSATPLYTAAARVLVDNSSIKALRDQSATSDSPASVTLDSQVEIIKSERVLLRVVKQLKLANEPEFQKQPGLVTRLRNTIAGLISSGEVARTEPIEDELLVDWLQRRSRRPACRFHQRDRNPIHVAKSGAIGTGRQRRRRRLSRRYSRSQT